MSSRLKALPAPCRGLRPGPWLRGFVFWDGAVATGATAVAFARGSDAALTLFYWAALRTVLWSWLAPPFGIALVAWLTQRVFPGTQGSGIPQTIAALSISNIDARNRLLSIRIAVGKLFLTLAALASGASIGREAPPFKSGPPSCIP
jgi:H+/Cl- antiporter ClcA